MATGFGFCHNCGTALAGPGQVFCITCGATLQPTAPIGAPPPSQGGMPVAPPPPPPYMTPVQPTWVPPSTAVTPAKSTTNPAMLLVGGLVIAAIVGVAFFAMNNASKGLPGTSGSPIASGSPVASASPSPTAGYAGSLAFNPKTIGCPSQPFTTTVVLPSSVLETDQITYQIDDTVIITQAVADFGLTKQADGKWSVSTDNPDGSSNCSMGPGVHTARLLDSSGTVLAQTSFTFVMLATPTPEPTPTIFSTSIVTVSPSSFSCSAADVEITLAIQLPASVPGSTKITSEVDGAAGTTTTVEASFEQQTDGSWLSSDTVSSSALCEELSVGQHRIGALDAAGKVMVESPFTIKP